jgi:hypothetical protein
MFYSLKEELARVDERQKFVLSENKEQDQYLTILKRDRDDQFREIARQLAIITADINSLKIVIASRSK